MTPESILTLVIVHALQILIVCGLASILIRFAPASHPRFVSGLWLIVLIKCLLPPLMPGPLSELLGFAAVTHQSSSAETRSPQTASIEPSVVVFAESDLLNTSGRPSPHQRSALPQNPPQPSNNVFTRVRSGLSSLSGWCERSLVSTIGRQGIIFILLLLIAGALHRVIATCIQFSRAMQDICRLRHSELSELFQHRVNMLCERLRLRSIPEVVVSESMYGPAVMGLHRKVIVLPACLVTRLSAETLDPILAHELLHIRAKISGPDFCRPSR